MMIHSKGAATRNGHILRSGVGAAAPSRNSEHGADLSKALDFLNCGRSNYVKPLKYSVE
jgi:hypothetical protein